MKHLLFGVGSCLLAAQAPPLTYENLQARAKIGEVQLHTERTLAEARRHWTASNGLLREGPTLSLSAGPRRIQNQASTTDQSAEIDLPLFLSPRLRQRLGLALNQADPLLTAAAQIESRFLLRKAYLDAWLEQVIRHLQEEDIATAQSWLKAAKARLEAGADAAFQVSLVESEVLRAQLEVMESRLRQSESWARLRMTAELPETPLPLADPGTPTLPDLEGLEARHRTGLLRRALDSRLALEEAALRHREALELSRWSLRGSYAKEGDERVTKAGLAYRFSRPGETSSVRRQTQAEQQSLRQELEHTAAGLSARFATALGRLETARALSGPQGLDEALQAITLRLEAGKERPSEALPIRRQLLEAKRSDLRRRHALHLLQAELETLTEGGIR